MRRGGCQYFLPANPELCPFRINLYVSLLVHLALGNEGVKKSKFLLTIKNFRCKL